MLREEMEPTTVPIIKKEDDDEDWSDFYYDQAYIQARRDRIFHEQFFVNASTDR
jgi:hypothetical protein